MPKSNPESRPHACPEVPRGDVPSPALRAGPCCLEVGHPAQSFTPIPTRTIFQSQSCFGAFVFIIPLENWCLIAI